MKRLSVALLLAAGSVMVARADLAGGEAAYRAGEFERAWNELRPLAEQGNAAAQYYLGRMAFHGQGKAQDRAGAADWYRKAAGSEHREAQNNLALMYEQGLGVPQDLAEAARWYERAAEQGLAVAQYNLGRLYEEGRGVRQDSEQATVWYRKAADGGHAGARKKLDEVAITTQPEVTPDATEAGISAFARADYAGALAAWQPLAEQGDAEAAYRLGGLYDRGLGVRQDAAAAETWYREAATRGHGRAMYDLGFLKLRGRDQRKDYAEAHVWFSLAAARSVGDASTWLEKIAVKMTREEMDRSARQAAELESKLSERDSPR